MVVATMKGMGLAVRRMLSAPLVGVCEVPFSSLASAWNAAKFLGPDSTALTEKTMPDPQ